LNRYAYTLNNPLKYTDPSGHIFVAALLGGALLGGIVGGLVELGTQIGSQLIQGTEVSVNLAEVAGAAAGGAVMGFTLGFGPASLGVATVLGAVGGAAGGQVGALTEAATSELLYEDGWNSEHVMSTARENGYGDWQKIVIDAGAGASSAAIGHGLTQLAQRPRTRSAVPAETLHINTHGQGSLVPDGVGRLKLPTSASEKAFQSITTGIWTLTKETTGELYQRGAGWFFEQFAEKAPN